MDKVVCDPPSFFIIRKNWPSLQKKQAILFLNNFIYFSITEQKIKCSYTIRTEKLLIFDMNTFLQFFIANP